MFYLDSFINYELQLRNFSSSVFTLDRIKQLLNCLGNPQKDLKIIHVAGSKGKGSTCAVIAHILKEAGYKVGLYTSPHLYTHNERVRILTSVVSTPGVDSGLFSDTITDDEINNILQKMKPAIERVQNDARWGALTFFEVYTALALVYFRDKKTDICVLETGLGGRLDATNATSSMVAVITPVSLEHTHILGDSVEQIAQEKAAIIKERQQRVVIAPQELEVKKIFKRRCQKFETLALFVDEEIQWQSIEQNLKGQKFSIKTKRHAYPDLKSPLIGKHQIANAAVAVGVIEFLASPELGFRVSYEAIRKGIKNIFWPGRFEVLTQKKPMIILDGAHNQASAKVLADTMEEVLRNRRVTLILGVSNDKNKKLIGNELNRIVEKIVVTKAHHPRADDFSESELNEMFPGKEVYLTSNTRGALNLAQKKTKWDDVILVAGSLFVVAEVRKL